MLRPSARLALCSRALFTLAAPLAATAQNQADALDVAEKEQQSRIDDILVTGRSEGYQTGETNTATKLPLSLRETPQSVTVFTRQRIEDFNLITIADVLEQTPGVTVQSYDSNRTRFQARGFTSPKGKGKGGGGGGRGGKGKGGRK